MQILHRCSRLNLISLAYLWRRDQAELLQEMIDCQLEAIVIKVASLGLTPERHLGKSIRDLQGHLVKMHEKYGVNICGEGGEYETFTLDCPLFKKRIVMYVQILQNIYNSITFLAFSAMIIKSLSAHRTRFAP